MRTFDTCDFIALATSHRWAEVRDFFPSEDNPVCTLYIDTAAPRTVGSCGLRPDVALMVNEPRGTLDDLEDLRGRALKVSKLMARMKDLQIAASELSHGRVIMWHTFTPDEQKDIRSNARRIKKQREYHRAAKVRRDAEWKVEAARLEIAHAKWERMERKTKQKAEEENLARRCLFAADPLHKKWQEAVAAIPLETRLAAQENLTLRQVVITAVTPEPASLLAHILTGVNELDNFIVQFPVWTVPPPIGAIKTIVHLPGMPTEFQWKLYEPARMPF